MDDFYQTLANEPTLPNLVGKSFLFVPSVGMRLGPEVLVLELMREIFFETRYDDGLPSGRDLVADDQRDDGTFILSLEERSVLHALRGRRKATKRSRAASLFAPAYPPLARHGWLGRKRERIIKRLLFEGAVGQHFFGPGGDPNDEVKEFAKSVVDALEGSHSFQGGGRSGCDILSVPLWTGARANELLTTESARERVEQLVRSSEIECFEAEADEISDRVTKDFQGILALERSLPRMQWLAVLMCFLRFALPMWLLAKMRLTSQFRQWLVSAMDDGIVPDEAQINSAIGSRHRGMLRPTLASTRQVFERIEHYMRDRVEVSILIRNLASADERLGNRKLTLRRNSSDCLRLVDFLLSARDLSGVVRGSARFTAVAPGLNVEQFLVREGERFAAWRNPRSKGQGKNIDEFLRVMYRHEEGDEAGSYLLSPEGRGIGRGFSVFPGQMLLKTIAFLAARAKRESRSAQVAGKLVLEDIEQHFQQYGVDFANAADARPKLIDQLQGLGLLSGSPDAGGSVAVVCPFRFQ